jgi:hypothetical protein
MSFGSNQPIEDESLERNDPFLESEEQSVQQGNNKSFAGRVQ